MEVANPVYNELRAKWKESAWHVVADLVGHCDAQKAGKGRKAQVEEKKGSGKQNIYTPQDRLSWQ